jgi:LAO/AO transport system kinase
LGEAISRHRAYLDTATRLQARRARQEEMWVDESVRARFGTAGLAAARKLDFAGGPFARERALTAELDRRLRLAN